MGIVAQLKKWSFDQKVASFVRDGMLPKQTYVLPGFNIRFMKPYMKQISIGIDCVLACQMIFERHGYGHISIGNRCHIGGNTKLISIDGVFIGDDVTIAWDCTIYDHDSHPLEWEDRKMDTLNEVSDLSSGNEPIAHKDWSRVRSKSIVIKDKAWLGFGVTVLKGVTIGEGAVVGAMSVITKDVPDYAIVVGNPARIVRMRTPEEGSLT